MKNSITNNEIYNKNYIDEKKHNNVFDFISSKKEHERKNNRVYIDILKSLYLAKKEIDEVENNFDIALDEDLIDYFTYRLKAAEARYQYLLKKAKEIK